MRKLHLAWIVPSLSDRTALLPSCLEASTIPSSFSLPAKICSLGMDARCLDLPYHKGNKWSVALPATVRLFLPDWHWDWAVGRLVRTCVPNPVGPGSDDLLLAGSAGSTPPFQGLWLWRFPCGDPSTPSFHDPQNCPWVVTFTPALRQGCRL